MGNVKRAHMVSRSYLRAWADSRNRVDVLDIEQGRGFTSAIGSATVVSYAYDPAVLTHDLEREFSGIESNGAPAIAKLRHGHQLSRDEMKDMTAFLDMHLERGRYADQTGIRTPAVLVKTDGSAEDAQFNLGDRLLLSRYMEGAVRLAALGVEQWPWEVREARSLATGDGAVLLWREKPGAEISVVTFPLSPTQLLVIGTGYEVQAPLNTLLAEHSRRWIVGTVGSLVKDQAAVIAGIRRAEPGQDYSAGSVERSL